MVAKLSLETELIVGAALVVVAGLLYVKYQGVTQVAAGAVGLAADALAGTVLGVGDALGVPRTDLSKGQADIAAGDWWAASFDLPAKDFLAAVWVHL